MRLRLKLHQAYVALMRQWPRSRWRLRLLGASGAWGVGSGRTRPGQGRVPGGLRAPAGTARYWPGLARAAAKSGSKKNPGYFPSPGQIGAAPGRPSAGGAGFGDFGSA